MLLPPEQAGTAIPTIASCKESVIPQPNNQLGATATRLAASLTARGNHARRKGAQCNKLWQNNSNKKVKTGKIWRRGSVHSNGSCMSSDSGDCFSKPSDFFAEQPEVIATNKNSNQPVMTASDAASQVRQKLQQVDCFSLFQWLAPCIVPQAIHPAPGRPPCPAPLQIIFNRWCAMRSNAWCGCCCHRLFYPKTSTLLGQQ